MNDAELFRFVASDQRLNQWIERERDVWIRYLTNAADPTQVYRAQGKLQLLDDMKACIEAAKNLR